MRWARQVACMGESRVAYRVWWKNLKRSLGRTRRRREDNIKMYLKGIV
jgi:hypothetical protein